LARNRSAHVPACARLGEGQPARLRVVGVDADGEGQKVVVTFGHWRRGSAEDASQHFGLRTSYRIVKYAMRHDAYSRSLNESVACSQIPAAKWSRGYDDLLALPIGVDAAPHAAGPAALPQPSTRRNVRRSIACQPAPWFWLTSAPRPMSQDLLHYQERYVIVMHLNIWHTSPHRHGAAIEHDGRPVIYDASSRPRRLQLCPRPLPGPADARACAQFRVLLSASTDACPPSRSVDDDAWSDGVDADVVGPNSARQGHTSVAAKPPCSHRSAAPGAGPAI